MIARITGLACALYRQRIKALATVACLRLPYRYDPEAVYRDCLAGVQELWTDGVTYCIVETLERTDGRFLWLAFAAGRLREALACYTQVEEAARALGYDAIAFTGRRGWSQVLPGFVRHDDDGWIKRLH
ncbi:MAG: hypothetical protein RXR20_20560 [Paraburkholderia sp.]|jgi:hypothetical protein